MNGTRKLVRLDDSTAESIVEPLLKKQSGEHRGYGRPNRADLATRAEIPSCPNQ